jgi:hypothetical protein
MALFDRFQALVGRDQGAARFFIRIGGFFNVGDVPGGANGTDVTGLQFKNIMLSPVTRTSFTMASAIQTVSVIPIGYGKVDIYYPSATTSVKLPVANPGATLLLNFPVPVASTISVLAGTSASIACGYSDCSMILLSMNGISGAWVQLQCMTANEWQVALTPNVLQVVAQRSS